MIIKDIHAYQILDPKGGMSFYCNVMLSDGTIGSACVPSAINDVHPTSEELLPIQEYIHGPLHKSLIGRNILDQFKIDTIISHYNQGIPLQKGLLSVSLAALDASAKHMNVPVWKRVTQLLYQIAGVEEASSLPTPVISLCEKQPFWDIMIIPKEITSFSARIYTGSEMTKAVIDIIEKKHVSSAFGTLEAVHTIIKGTEHTIEIAIRPHNNVSHGNYRFPTIDGKQMEEYTIKTLTQFYVALTGSFPITMIENPCEESNEERSQYFAQTLKKIRPHVLLVSHNPSSQGNMDGAVIHPYTKQTFLEILQSVLSIKQENQKIIFSTMGEETTDGIVMDIAAGVHADMFEGGMLTEANVIAYNRGILIEEELLPTK